MVQGELKRIKKAEIKAEDRVDGLRKKIEMELPELKAKLVKDKELELDEKRRELISRNRIKKRSIDRMAEDIISSGKSDSKRIQDRVHRNEDEVSEWVFRKLLSDLEDNSD